MLWFPSEGGAPWDFEANGMLDAIRPAIDDGRITVFCVPSFDGSSWSAGALDQWIADVHASGIQINYTADGSTTGRQNFILGQSDFAASDIPFQM